MKNLLTNFTHSLNKTVRKVLKRKKQTEAVNPQAVPENRIHYADKKMLSFLPFYIYLCIIVVLFFANYTPGTYLTGWDNLHPEFDFWMNIKRSLFAVWQEYQGLGLLGGMGHAADLPRQLFLLLISSVVPSEGIRYFYHFLMLFVGTAGIYKFISDHITERSENFAAKTASFLGGLYYLLNFGTIQYFYVPFEPYSTFWGLFPWLLHSLFLYLKKPGKKQLLYLSVIHFLAVPIAYVQTIFAVYLICVGFILFLFLLKKGRTPLSIVNWKHFKTALLVGTTIFIVNAFWLLPNLFFVLNNLSITQDAMQNRMATEKFFQMNQYRGTLFDFVLLKEFYYDFGDINQQTGQFGFLMQEWREHLSKPWVIFTSIAIFAVALYGTFQKTPYRKYLLALLAISLVIFLSDTPPFSFVNSLFRSVPLVNQIFRNPFTKFIVPAVFILGIFFSLGAYRMLNKFSEIKKMTYLFTAAAVTGLFILSLPAFNGEYVSKQMRVQIPDDYFQTFEYFKTQNKNGRIMNLPQENYWGWYYYNWGLHGSGFLWYGIEQPIMDRAFDVWSKPLEEYYWELSYAINKRDKELFNKILQKYDISYILFDDSLSFSDNINASKADLNQRNLLIDNEMVTLDKQFGSVSIYKTTPAINPVASYTNLPEITTSEEFSYIDTAYGTNGNYISSSSNTTTRVYPLGSLFTNRFQEERAFDIEDKGTYYALSFPIKQGSYQLTVPSLTEIEPVFPVRLTANRSADIITIRFEVVSPVIVQNGKSLQNTFFLRDLQLPIGDEENNEFILNVNNQDFFELNNLAEEFQTIGTTFLINEDTANYVRIYSALPEREYDIEPGNFREAHQCDNSTKKGAVGLDIASGSITISAENKASCALYSHSFLVTGNPLWKAEFEYKSKSDEFPQFCMTGRTGTCLNKKDTIKHGFSEDFSQFSEYYENTNTEINELFFQMILDATSDQDAGLSKAITYKNVRLKLYPYISGNAITFGETANAYTVPLEASSDGKVEIQIQKLHNSFGFTDPIARNIFKTSVLNYDTTLSGPSSIEVHEEDNKQFVRLSAEHASSYFLQSRNDLKPYYGYLVDISARNREGFPLIVNTFTNKNLSTYAYTYGSDSSRFSDNYFFLPPYYEFDEGISILLGSSSYSRKGTVNDIASIEAWPVPFRYLSSLSYEKNDAQRHTAQISETLANKKSLFLYEVTQAEKGDVISLSQSYDKGWNMYVSKNNLSSDLDRILFSTFPFLFGEKAGEHVEINNWKNGWRIDREITPQNPALIVYSPQYLEFLGFFALILGNLILIPKFIHYPESMKMYSLKLDIRSEILKKKIHQRLSGRQGSAAPLNA